MLQIVHLREVNAMLMTESDQAKAECKGGYGLGVVFAVGVMVGPICVLAGIGDGVGRQVRGVCFTA